MKLYEMYGIMETWQHICDSQIAWYCEYDDDGEKEQGRRTGFVAYGYDNDTFIRLPTYKDWAKTSVQDLDVGHLTFCHVFIRSLS